MGIRLFRSIVCFAFLSGILFLLEVLCASDVSVKTVVEKDEVYVGESFVFQIQIEGAGNPHEPDFSSVQDFAVEKIGGEQNNSESVTIINGRVSRVTHHGYVFSYRLTPKKTGTLIIPSLEVQAGGEKVHTRAVRIIVSEPQETEDFKLRMSLSQNQCFIGEPVILTVVWYINKGVREMEFTMPLLDDKRFALDDTEIDTTSSEDLFAIPIGAGKVIAKKGQGVLDGKTYTTLTFQKVLIPKQAGVMDMPRSIVSCSALVGSTWQRDTYKKFVTPSNYLKLEVKELPETGKPPGFKGHIGSYKLSVAASPLEVYVGDPITLTITVSGPLYLKNVELPPLDQDIRLNRHFKVPKEMSSGKLANGQKIFTQTIRAMHDNVREIPSIELPYFDTTTGKYAIAHSKSIPLKVLPTKVITAQDAEGTSKPLKSELELWSEGIAYNYEDISALKNQDYRVATLSKDRRWYFALLFPFACYIVLLGSVTYLRKKQANPEVQRAKKAYRHFLSALDNIAKSPNEIFSELLEAIRDYLGSKLRISTASMTYRDVEAILKAKDVKAETMEQLRKIFDECEASKYAGGSDTSATSNSIVNKAQHLVEELERSLK